MGWVTPLSWTRSFKANDTYVQGCNDPNNSTTPFRADIIGCMDENNLNYDPDANINDGDKCGGCIQGFTRIGDSSFTCQEVGGKYIDCKTAEVFWKLKSEFKYRPPKESSNCSWWAYIGKCHEIRVPAISNDGVITRTKHNRMHQTQTPQWSYIKDDIESKCGSIAELPITPEEVPNFLPASSTPSVSSSQDLSTQTDTDQTEPIYGCTDVDATNYDATATEDDGTCETPSSLNMGYVVGGVGVLIGLVFVMRSRGKK